MAWAQGEYILPIFPIKNSHLVAIMGWFARNCSARATYRTKN
jgi:hypothetical protein